MQQNRINKFSAFGILLFGIFLFVINSSCTSSTTTPIAGTLPSLEPSSTFTGRASAGPISAATVKVYKAESNGTRGALVATSTTDANGNYDVSIPVSTGPVFVVVTGGTYIEEASGSAVSLGTSEMTAIVSSTSLSKSVSITPLTHLATERAITLAANGSELATAIASANGAVAVAAGLSSSTDITAIVPALPGQSLSAQGHSASAPEAQYALFLAALSQYGHDNGGANSLSVMTTFASDFGADGKFNATGSAWTTGIASAQTSYIANPNNSGVFSGSSSTTPVSIPPPAAPATPWAGLTYLGTSGRETTGVAGIATDFEGNIFIAGYTDGNLDSGTYLGIQAMHAHVSKYNSAGVKQWTRLLPSTGASVSIAAYGLSVDGAGNVIIVGSSTGPIAGSTAVDGGPFVVKYNGAGVKQWSQQIAAVATGCKVATDSAGNVLITGLAFEGLYGVALTGYIDVFIIKYDSAGARLWTRQIGPPSPASAALDIISGGGIATDSSDNIYIAAATEGVVTGTTMSGNIDTFLVKYNSAGTRQWIKQFGVSGADTYAAAVAVDLSGNVLISGYTGGDLEGETKLGMQDAYITKFTSAGTQSWTRLIGGSSASTMSGGITSDHDGNIYAVGYVSGAPLDGLTQVGNQDFFIAKYNSSGTMQWTRETGVASHEVVPYGVVVDSFGSIFASGTTNGSLNSNSLNGSADAFIVKYDSAGTSQ